MFRKLTVMFVGLLGLFLVACGGDNYVSNPVFQPQIVNQTDNFSFQATAVNNVTQTLQYTWQNTGVRANIDQSSLIASGSSTLTIRDAAGTQVFSAPLGSGATVVSSTGVAGNWTIAVTLTNINGTLNFRVQRGA